MPINIIDKSSTLRLVDNEQGAMAILNTYRGHDLHFYLEKLKERTNMRIYLNVVISDNSIVSMVVIEDRYIAKTTIRKTADTKIPDIIGILSGAMTELILQMMGKAIKFQKTAVNGYVKT